MVETDFTIIKPSILAAFIASQRKGLVSGIFLLWHMCYITSCMIIYLIKALRQKMHLWTCAQSKNSDQSAHLRSLIRIYTGRILDRQECKVSSCGQRRLWHTQVGQDRSTERYDFGIFAFLGDIYWLLISLMTNPYSINSFDMLVVYHIDRTFVINILYLPQIVGHLNNLTNFSDKLNKSIRLHW